MAKEINAKCKLCRRVGEKLFLKGERCNTTKCAMVKRNYPPGFHGPKGKKRLTDYGNQLNEKQKARRQYNLLEKQFRLTFDKAKSKKGNTGEVFLKILETRFDNVVYRAGFAPSRPSARQLINHNHFEVNGKKVNIPSYILKSGDVVAIKGTKKDGKVFSKLSETLKNKELPGWLNVDAKKLEIKVLHEPDMKTINPNFNVQLIVEFYSK